jgi:hypothetical protein
MERFGKVVKLTAFKPFSSAANALEQINAVSEAQLTDDLKNFLTMNLPKARARGGGGSAGPAGPLVRGAGECSQTGTPLVTFRAAGPVARGAWLPRARPEPFCSAPAPKSVQAKEGKKSKKFQLGVFEAKLGSAIQEATGVSCVCSELVGEVLRGCRAHFTRFIGDLKEPDLKRAQLGLAHSYSRAKVKFNVNKVGAEGGATQGLSVGTPAGNAALCRRRPHLPTPRHAVARGP